MNQVTCFLMDSTGSLKVWCFVRSWDASFMPGKCTWRTCLPHKFNWRYLTKLQNQPCVLFPMSCAKQADAESHFSSNLKCSSTAGTDMVHHPSPTGAAETGDYSFRTVGTWRAQAMLSCGSKHQILGGRTFT